MDQRPTLKQLWGILLPKLIPNWKHLCVAIELDGEGSTLRTIESQYRGNPAECCEELIVRWIDEKPGLTWQTVIERLKEAKCANLAEDVERHIEKQCLEQPQKLAVPNNNKSPLLKEMVHESESDSLNTQQQATEISTFASSKVIPTSVQCNIATCTTASKEDLSYGEPKPISLNFSLENIRAYQRELAQPGINGDNYIICAPTGSGKTLVAALIISEHFKRRQEIREIGKVVFLVKTQQLAIQQRNHMKNYLNGARVDMVIGMSEQLIASLISSIDLVVCTAGKLLNELKSKALSMKQFSLLVVDECHHTVGNDYYSEVMEFYLMEKLRGNPNQAPQVVGLTASPGAGKGKSPTLFKAIGHQLNLCAHLDASKGIKMVTDNIQELSEHTNKPEHILHELHETRNTSDPLFILLIGAMKKLEDLIDGGPPFNRRSLQYGKWIEKEKEMAEMRKSPEERDRISVLEHLGQYYLALITYEDFNSEDAIEVLKETEEYPSEQATPLECDLNLSHTTLLSDVSKLSFSCNPLLEEVEKILVKQFSTKPKSKCIFFVREIRHTQYVKHWIESRSELKSFIRVSSIVGYTRAGMTKEQQREVIQGFREDKYNLIVSTSILEEGIDIAACNLVIRFQTMSNEIAELQAKGRARAVDSKMYTILSSQSQTQFLQIINAEKQELSLKAPSLVNDLCMTPKFREIQDNILLEKDKREKALALRKRSWNPEEVEIRCKKCKNMACKASDVYTLEPHYVVPDRKFLEKIIRRPHHKQANRGNMSCPYKIYCKTCNQDWGIWSWWKRQCTEQPVLKCKSFIFEHKNDSHLGKKWGEVPFHVRTLSSLEED